MKKTEEVYRAVIGHIEMIYGAIQKFAKAHGLKICKLGEFKEWSKHDVNYLDLHSVWVENTYDDDFAPVVSRRKFMEGYLIGNLYWGRKRQFGISKKQKAHKSKVTDIMAGIERAQANAAQAILSPEEVERALEQRRQIKAVKERQEAKLKELREKNYVR